MADKTEDIKKQAQESAVVIEDALRSISSQIGDIFKQALDEGADVSKTMAKDVQSSLNSLSKVSKGLATSFEKASQGAFSIKDLTKEIQERTAKISSIESQIEIARRNGVTNTKALETELKKVKSTNDAYVKELNKANDLSKNINKSVGLTGAALKGVGAAATKIGFSGIGDVMEEANQAAIAKAKALGVSETKSLGLIGKIKTMGAGFKVVGKAILKNLTDPLALAGLLMKGLKMAVGFVVDAYKKGEEAFMRISDENVGIARSLGMSQKAANSLAGSVAGMGPTTAASKASIEGIYKAMGSTEKLSANTLKVFVKLNTFAGMSADSLAKFQKFAKKSGEDAGTLVSAMAKTAGSAIKNNKLAMTQRDLLEETANQSSYVKLQFAGQGPALVNAVAQSKALGLNMKSARDMASSLLNFEDSIAAEMEAELLTGKQLNLEEARALALKGDNVGAAKLIAEQVGGAAEFMSMNVIQQEALAKAAGMGVDEMSNMLSGQQDMKAEGDDLVKNQEDGIKAMTSQVSAREVAENRARRAAEGNIAIYKDMEKPVNAIKEAWTSIKNSFASMVSENITKPLGDFLSSPEGIAFIKGLPAKFEEVGGAIKGIITKVGTFMKEHPTLMRVLGVGAAAGGLIKGAFMLKDKISGKRDGSSSSSALFVQMDGNSEGNNPLDSIVEKLGKRSTFLAKIPKLLSKVTGGKSTLVGKGLRDLTAMMLKRSSLLNQTVKNSSTLSKFFPKMATLTSKVPIKEGANILSKLAPSLAKSLKVLGPIGVAADLVIGGAKGAGQADLSKKEQKAAGVKEGIGSFMSTALGVLTGGAEKGSMFTEMAGGEKGSAGDELAGIGTAAARGAMAGGAIGLALAPLTAGISVPVATAIGAVVGTVSEGFKVFSNPDSALRKGVIDFASSTSEKISGWASTTGEKMSNFASSTIDSVSSLGTKIKDKFIEINLKIVSIISSIPGKIIDKIKSVGGKVASLLGFATGGIAPGGFQAFADGGIVTKPTFGLVGEGSMNEAIIPLPDGKSVPVKVQGGGSNNSSNAQVITLLKELITVVKSGGDVILDGSKVGTAMVAGSYRMQ